MPNYIMDLRKLVGHRTLMQLIVQIFYLNNHKWDMPGVLKYCEENV